MTKILHILSAPRAEGTPRLVLDWLDCDDPELVQEIMFIHPEGELSATFNSRGEWQYYNSAFRLGVKTFPKLILLVRNIVRDRRPDMVVCWNTGIAPWVAIGAKLAGPVKVISHAGNFPGSKWAFHTLLHTNILAYVHLFTGSKVICCSNYIRDSYQQVPMVPFKVFDSVYNCLSIGKFSADLPWNERTTDAIMVATLERHKDHRTLLEAWKILEDKGMSYKLLLVGNGSQKAVLEQYAYELGLSNVAFLGSRNDVSDLLKNAKVFVFSTTVEEGFGTVLIEALASGCHVIASDVPACREILQGGKYGVLVAKDSSSALAESVYDLLNSTNESNNLSIKKYLRKFTVSEMINHYKRLANLN